MKYEIEFSDEFGVWWDSLTEAEQDSIDKVVDILQERGTALKFPYSSDVKGSKHGQMRELRVQHQGQPYRILYAFDPRRMVMLLIGGNKTGDGRWYETYVPLADKIYDAHLVALKKEGLI